MSYRTIDRFTHEEVIMASITEKQEESNSSSSSSSCDSKLGKPIKG